MSRKIEEFELTAHAFGEADDALRLRVEAELAENQEAREFVDELKRAAELVRQELANDDDDDLVLRPEQLERIERRARGTPPPEIRSGRQRSPRWAGRVVAVAAVASVVGVVVLTSTTMMMTRATDRIIAVESAPPPATLAMRDPGYVAQQQLSTIPAVPAIVADPTSAARFDHGPENGFHETRLDPQSTFSIDVDTASYGILRRHLTHWTLPPREAVRVEEMINYFDWDLPPPKDGAPIAIHADLTDAPWKPDHLLARIALKGKELREEERRPMNLVFLIDVSGSMAPEDRLPLLKRALQLLVKTLTERDSIAIVVYAGASGLVLPPTPGDRHREILGALDRLQAGGSTNGGAGIALAYNTAVGAFIRGGSNRVVLATDGDFNVGVTSNDALVSMIEAKAKSGVFLTVLGFGMSNLNDSMLEKLADHGDGNYAYVDDLREAQRILIDRSAGTLETIAKDVKVQVEFNRERVAGYRLIGYENRLMAAHEFNDDAKDAGEMGAGHAVTMLYELVPAKGTVTGGEMFSVKVRYKSPEGGPSRELSRGVREKVGLYDGGRTDLKFGAAIAEFAMVLSDSAHRGNATLSTALELAESGVGRDLNGERRELVEMISRAMQIENGQRR